MAAARVLVPGEFWLRTGTATTPQGGNWGTLKSEPAGDLSAQSRVSEP
jgi:hypothetical protein